MRFCTFVLLFCSIYSKQIYAQDAKVILNRDSKNLTNFLNPLNFLNSLAPEPTYGEDEESKVLLDLLVDKSFFEVDPDPEVYDGFVNIINEATLIWERGLGKDIFNVIKYENLEQSESEIIAGPLVIKWSEDFFVRNKNLEYDDDIEDVLATTFASIDPDTGDVVGNIVVNANQMFFDCTSCDVASDPLQKFFARKMVQNFDMSSKSAHFRTVIAHELGHILGILHVEGNSSLMKEEFGGLEIIERLSPNDILAYEAIYNKK